MEESDEREEKQTGDIQGNYGKFLRDIRDAKCRFEHYEGLTHISV